jgi:hypothetical protein
MIWFSRFDESKSLLNITAAWALERMVLEARN